MRNLILKEWRENGWLFAGALAGALLVVVQRAAAFDASALSVQLGVLVLSTALGVMIAAQTVAGEVESDTIGLLVTRPVSRDRIWAAKWLAGAAMVGASAVFGHLLELLVLDGFTRVTPAAQAAETVALSLLGYSVAFFLSTQLDRRLDAALWSLMLAAAAQAALGYSHLRVQPAALAAAAGFALASGWAFTRGQTMRGWPKRLHGASGLAVAVVLGLCAMQGQHVLYERLAVPAPARIDAFTIVDPQTVLLSVQTTPSMFDLFKLPDCRVARLDIGSGRLDWLPGRWSKLNGAEAGQALLTGYQPVWGYPFPAFGWALDLKTFSETPEDVFKARQREGYYLFNSGRGETARSELRRGYMHPDHLIFGRPGLTLSAFWVAGDEILLLGRERDTGEASILGVNRWGQVTFESPVPGAASSSIEVTDQCYDVVPVAGGPDRPPSHIWLRLKRVRDQSESWVMLETDGKRAAWRVVASDKLAGGKMDALPDGWLLTTIEGDEAGWTGHLARYRSDGSRAAHAPLGPGRRVGELTISKDGAKALVRVESRADGPTYFVIDTRSLAAKRVLRGVEIPPRPSATLGWLDASRWIYSTDRSIHLVDDTGRAPRTVISF